MSIRGSGRWLLWICGVGAFAALATAVVSWKDIVVHYHLEQLRQDPALLPIFLDASTGTAKNLVATAFARQPLGRAVAVSLFLDCFAKARAEPRGIIESRFGFLNRDDMQLGKVNRAILGFHAGDKIIGKRRMFWGDLRWGEAFEAGWFFFPKDPGLVTWAGRSVYIDATRIVALAELLMECRGATFDLPNYPGLTVEVLTCEAALDRVKSWTEPLKFLTDPSGAPVAGSIPPQSTALLLSRKIQ